MSRIKAFRAVRPATGYGAKIAALPYDVYSEAEARAYVADKPDSFLKIDRAETFFEPGIDSHSSPVYEKAREKLYEMLAQGKLVQDEAEALYIYELTMAGRSQAGLVACTSVDDYLGEGIKEHEKTRADKELDRINHVDRTDANTGPIFLTYKAQTEISDIIQGWMAEHDPVEDFLADDGVGHKVWRMDAPEVLKVLEEKFAAVEALYIADGHHRAASAVKVALKRRRANPGYTGEEEFNFFLSVIFPDEMLKILPYNRVVADLNGLDSATFLEKVAVNFEVTAEDAPVLPEAKAVFGMFLENRWYRLTAKVGSYDDKDPVTSLDVSILQDNLLAPILDIDDPTVAHRIDFVGGIRGLGALEKRVREDMAVAFSMYPTAIEELMGIADADKLMPPKSTWFEPKLRSGLFIHLLS